MKKVLVAVALVMGLGSSVAFAQNAENANAVVATAQAPQDEYTKIEVKDLPAAVTEALGKAYPESMIGTINISNRLPEQNSESLLKSTRSCCSGWAYRDCEVPSPTEYPHDCRTRNRK